MLSKAKRLMHLLDYVRKSPPPLLKVRFNDLVKALMDTSSDYIKGNMTIASALKKKLGLPEKNNLDKNDPDMDRHALFMCFARICNKKVTGLEFFRRSCKVSGFRPIESFEFVTFLCLTLDFWYDNQSMDCLEVFLDSNCRASVEGSNSLIKHHSEGLLKPAPGEDVVFSHPVDYEPTIDTIRTHLPDPLEPMTVFFSTGSSYTKDNMEKSRYDKDRG